MIGLRGRRRVGGLLWLLGAGVAVAWGAAEHQAGRGVRGIGRAIAMDVAAPETARIASVEVDLHDAVARGQVVVRLDTSLIEQERLEYEGEVLATADANLSQAIQSVREHDRARTAGERARIAELDLQVRRLTALRSQGAATAAEVEEARAKLEAARLRVTPDEPPDEDTTNPWWVAVALGRLGQAEARLESFSLRSDLDGKVEAVYRRAGEIAVAGEPLVRVRRPVSDEVLAWVAPEAVPAVGAPATVIRADGRSVSGSVRSIGDGPSPLPLQALLDPRVQEWGVLVRVGLEGGAVAPDEPVLVRVSPAGASMVPSLPW